MSVQVYYSGAWRTATNIWVFTGGSWQPVKRVWGHHDGAWRAAFNDMVLGTITVSDSSFGCDATLGQFQVSWTTSGDTTGANLFIDYNFDGGSGYSNLATIDPTTSPYDGDVSGEVGFTSLDSTYFRIRLSGAEGAANSSPQFASPAYACL